jgi:outer membrane protein TolC
MMIIIRIILYLCSVSLFFFIARPVSSLTIDEAIEMAKRNAPFYRATELKIRATEALYKATLSPYLPVLDVSTLQSRHYTSSIDYNTRNYEVKLSYTIFDGGIRRNERDLALLNLDIDREEFRKSLLELEYQVRVAYYTVIATKEILDLRTIQLKDAEKDHEVAEGRYRFGVARFSDVLQASVRLQQARFNLAQAEGDMRKALSELNSLIGRDLDSPFDLQGSLNTDFEIPERERLFDAGMKRPEVIQAEKNLSIAERNRSKALSPFFPVLSLNASYSKTEGGIFRFTFPEEKRIDLSATWNIFELGKFFRLKSFEREIDISSERLKEVKRQTLLDIYRAIQDLSTAMSKVKVAEEQLRQAQHNYEQAFGEYKVGKADILSLVQAESQLATAREQLINSRLSVILSKSLLERIAALEIKEVMDKR